MAKPPRELRPLATIFTKLLEMYLTFGQIQTVVLSPTVCVSVPPAVSHRRAAGVRGISEAILRTNGGDTCWWAGVDSAHYTENAREQNKPLFSRTNRARERSRATTLVPGTQWMGSPIPPKVPVGGRMSDGETTITTPVLVRGSCARREAPFVQLDWILSAASGRRGQDEGGCVRQEYTRFRAN
jgi:hypothetical protein